MITFAPSYYKKFKCISSRCKHNCCIGWEIDIDSDTFEKYQSTNGEFWERLRNGINISDEVPSFKLTEEKERCVFLREDNLCEIICNLGENSLCQICTDHPRFRSFYENITEIGLGLCCEEAARIILSEDEPFELYALSEDSDSTELTEEEEKFFFIRNRLFSVIERADIDPLNKAEQIVHFFGGDTSPFDFSSAADLLCSLEKFDKDADKEFCRLKAVQNVEKTPLYSFGKELSNLLCCFVYRHLPLVFEGFSYKQVAYFIRFCFQAIYGLCLAKQTESGNLLFDDITEIARMFSCEVEYSDVNIDIILDYCDTQSS